MTADARFLGGAIMPGLRTSADQLTRRAAKLPATELRAPARVIGRRTEECIQAGVLFGAADAVDGMVRRITAEWPGKERPRVVATGGLASIVAPISSDHRAHRPRSHPAGLRIAAGHVGLGVVSRARQAGYRLLGPRFDYLLHTRPVEWPIVAAHTAVGYLLAVGLPNALRGEASGPRCWGSGSG